MVANNKLAPIVSAAIFWLREYFCTTQYQSLIKYPANCKKELKITASNFEKPQIFFRSKVVIIT